MEYFVIINGVQSGPLSKDRLITAGIQPDSYVWRQGLADWVKADTLPELADIFMGDSAFGGYARPEQSLDPYARQAHRMPQPPYGGNGYGNTPPDPYTVYGRANEPIPHTNWLPWAIAGTIFGALFSCIGMIFGIIGITKANAANKFYNEGFGQNGDMSNSSARTMTIIALVLGGIGFLLTVTGTTSMLINQIAGLGN